MEGAHAATYRIDKVRTTATMTIFVIQNEIAPGESKDIIGLIEIIIPRTSKASVTVEISGISRISEDVIRLAEYFAERQFATAIPEHSACNFGCAISFSGGLQDGVIARSMNETSTLIFPAIGELIKDKQFALFQRIYSFLVKMKFEPRLLTAILSDSCKIEVTELIEKPSQCASAENNFISVKKKESYWNSINPLK